MVFENFNSTFSSSVSCPFFPPFLHDQAIVSNFLFSIKAIVGFFHLISESTVNMNRKVFS